MAFYSAVHYTLAGLIGINHPFSYDSQTETAHTRQANEVNSHFGRICYINYRKLYEASIKIRYIKDYNGEGINPVPSLNYLQIQEVEYLVNTALETIFQEVNKKSPVKLS